MSTSLVQQAGSANAEGPAYTDTATGVVYEDVNGTTSGTASNPA